MIKHQQIESLILHVIWFARCSKSFLLVAATSYRGTHFRGIRTSCQYRSVPSRVCSSTQYFRGSTMPLTPSWKCWNESHPKVARHSAGHSRVQCADVQHYSPHCSTVTVHSTQETNPQSKQIYRRSGRRFVCSYFMVDTLWCNALE